MQKARSLICINLLTIAVLGSRGLGTVEAAVRYVDADAGGANNGTSWTDAYVDLAAALTAAVSGDEIWVAQGTYKPTTGTDRAVSFVMKNGVGVYGGFVGTESLRTERNSDPAGNGCVLSGDIGVSGTKTDNSNAVVKANSCDATAILDGFTVRDGYGASGCGLTMTSSAAKITNCIFRDNEGTSQGGALFMSGAARFTNCRFLSNRAVTGGAAYMNYSNPGPVFVGCKFIGNSASGQAGAAYLNTNAIMVNCAFHGNSCVSNGSAIYAQASIQCLGCVFTGNNCTGSGSGSAVYVYVSGSPTLTQCTLAHNNSASSNCAGLYVTNGACYLNNTILWGNNARGNTNQAAQVTWNSGSYGSVTLVACCIQSYGGTIPLGTTADPVFVDFNGDDNLLGTEDDDVRLTSPTSSCIDRGVNALVPADTYDLDGDGNTTEFLPYDYAGISRFWDDAAVTDLGNGPAPVADIGARETGAPGLNIVQYPSARTRVVGQSTSFSVAANGVGTLQYQWQINSGGGWSDISGATAATYTRTGLTLGDTGIQFRCVVTDSVGSVNSPAASLTVISTARLYVKADAAGANNGSSWANAFTDLQNALSNTNSGEGWEVWVAAGTYKSSPYGSRTTYLQMKNGTALYGGFAGTETQREQRNSDPTTNNCVISGNVTYSTAYHVVFANNVNATSVLDGFTLTAANAYGAAEPYGGGMYINGGSPTVRNCRFHQNTSYSGGGGMGIVGNPNITITDCIFSDNACPYNSGGGGGIYLNATGGTVTFIRCKIIRNNSRGGGGIMALGSSTNSFYNCYIAGNDSGNDGGGGFHAGYGTVYGYQCTIYGNHASYSGGGTYGGTFRNSIFWGNSVTGQYPQANGAVITYSDVQGGYTGTGNFNADPKFVNIIGADGTFATIDDDFHLQQDSPCIGGGDNASAALYSISTTAAGTTTTAVVASANIGKFMVGDEIEYDSDNVQRTVTIVGSPANTLTFEPALPSSSVSGKTIRNYTGGDFDGDDRLINCKVDAGCDEAPYYIDCDNNGIGDDCDILTGSDCNNTHIPDVCELDSDLDGLIDDCDNCDFIANPDQANSDGDAAGNVCDECPSDPNKIAPGLCGCGIADSLVTTITHQPANASQCVGNNAQFSITATGTALTYQWYKAGTPLSNDGRITGATSNLLRLIPTVVGDTGSYTCVVTGGCQSATSNTATLSVTPLPTITQHPANAYPRPGQSATFTCAATGGGPYSYQWRRGTSSLTAGPHYAGVNGSSLQVLDADESTEGSDYNCVITGACGSVTTNTAGLFLFTATVIDTQPSNAYTCVGGSAAFTCAATGSGPVSFQWRRGSTPLADNAHYAGTASATLTVTNADASVIASDYNCLATAGGGTATTANVSLAFRTAPAISGADTRSLTVAEGSSCGVVFNNFTVTATCNHPAALNWSIATPPALGTASVNGSGTGGTGSFCYVPASGQFAPTSFVVRVQDPCGQSDQVTIEVRISPPPVITAWRAIKNHTSFGDVVVPLDPTKTNSDTGTNGPTTLGSFFGVQKIEVVFDQPMAPASGGTLEPSDITILDQNNQPHSASTAALDGGQYGTVLTLLFAAPLPDGNRYTFDLGSSLKSAVSGTVLTGDAQCQVRSIAGDVTGDGAVGLSDVAAVKSYNRAALSEATAPYDLNLDGKINLIDAALARSRHGHAAP